MVNWALLGSNGRPLKSSISLKETRSFSSKFTGKRVDIQAVRYCCYPKLKFHQCGIPKEMALELFKRFIINELVNQGLVTNVKAAKRKD